MKLQFEAKFLLTLLIGCFFLVGCGGGGGGGGAATAIAPTATSGSISQSDAATGFIAKQIAEPYANINNYSMPMSRRSLAQVRSATLVNHGVGTARISFDTRDTVYLWGSRYTYYSGYQDYTAKDILGNLTMDENLIDSLEITSSNMGCEILDSGNLLNLVYNGSFIISGLKNKTQLTIQVKNLNVSGTINNTEQINWTINGLVSINQQSYPYPVSGSNESGTLVFNGKSYSYATSYNGTNLATVKLSGEESIEMSINLATGAVLKVDKVNATNNSGTSLIGTWKLVEEDRDGLMLPVRQNDAGKVSMIYFYENSTFRIESIDRDSNSNINYWQTRNDMPAVLTGTYSFDGQNLKLMTTTDTSYHLIALHGERLIQTNQFSERFVWQKI